MPATTAKKPKGRAKPAPASDLDDDAPEEVRASDADVQRLRELHDTAPVAARKRRKPSKQERAAVDRDAALDASVLEALEDADFEQEEEEEEQQQEEEEQDSRGKKRAFKIDKMARRSKKIGHITVTTLGKGDILEAFIEANTKTRAKSVSELVGSAAPRTRFGVWAAQKKGEPAKGFGAKR